MIVGRALYVGGSPGDTLSFLGCMGGWMGLVGVGGHRMGLGIGQEG